MRLSVRRAMGVGCPGVFRRVVVVARACCCLHLLHPHFTLVPPWTVLANGGVASDEAPQGPPRRAEPACSAHRRLSLCGLAPRHRVRISSLGFPGAVLRTLLVSPSRRPPSGRASLAFAPLPRATALYRAGAVAATIWALLRSRPSDPSRCVHSGVAGPAPDRSTPVIPRCPSYCGAAGHRDDQVRPAMPAVRGPGH